MRRVGAHAAAAIAVPAEHRGARWEAKDTSGGTSRLLAELEAIAVERRNN